MKKKYLILVLLSMTSAAKASDLALSIAVSVLKTTGMFASGLFTGFCIEHVGNPQFSTRRTALSVLGFSALSAFGYAKNFISGHNGLMFTSAAFLGIALARVPLNDEATALTSSVRPIVAAQQIVAAQAAPHVGQEPPHPTFLGQTDVPLNQLVSEYQRTGWTLEIAQRVLAENRARQNNNNLTLSILERNQLQAYILFLTILVQGFSRELRLPQPQHEIQGPSVGVNHNVGVNI